MTKQMWDKKYLPVSIDEYIFQDENQERLIREFVKNKNFNHLILAGKAGTGKTSLAYLLKHELNVDDVDFLKIDGSADTGKDNITITVRNFISSIPMSSDFKIVLLDEADRLSKAAQDALKGMMVDYADNARFILTCNSPNKLINPLFSRCTTLTYDHLDKNLMALRFGKILKKEKIKVDAIETIYDYVNACYPDFRHLLISAQNSIVDNKLAPYSETITEATEFMVKALEFIESNDWNKAREFLSSNVPDEKWEECYRFLYDYLHNVGKFEDDNKWKQGIIIIADHLYRHMTVADPEINFTSCLIKLSEI